MEIPAGVTLEVAENTDTHMYLVLPATPSKEELIDAFAKVDACSDAGHLARNAVEKTIAPRVQYYARLFFSERDIEDMGASIPLRKKSAATAFGWGCKSAFNALAALPLPKTAGHGMH